MIQRQIIASAKMPFPATWLAFSRSPAPSARLRMAFMPTPVPTFSAIISICTGKARVRAATALSPAPAIFGSTIRLTKKLSTTLYRAWIVIEIMSGHAMLMTSFPMDSVPILFCSM